MNLNNKLELNKVYHGFKVLQLKYIKEINTHCYELVHEQSGAKLAYLANDDDNKVFSISFRTTPKDDTGVAHIVEHSVLCGSRKFPSKEPFVELVKGSLNTFLNAMTFPDKTMYPIASKNAKDFRNLMDVYLDAVFYPNMIKDDKVLQQEGWHYEIADPEAPLTYSGVVYNEMKGALAAPDSILDRKAMNYLYPSTTYQYESGGDPDYITNLTQEDFLAFHQKYYHPCNSYIFLYGDLDIQDNLKFINDEYLSNFERISVDSSIGKQEGFTQRHYHQDKYPIAPGESTENKTFHSLNYSIGTSLDHETALSFAILGNAILDAEGAPLRETIIAANLAEDVNSSYENGIYQPFFSINLIGSEADRAKDFEAVVEQGLKDIVSKGIDKDLLRAAINTLEFSLREGDTGSTPKGLLMNISMMGSWLYDGDPFVYLAFEEIIGKLKAWAESNYFEELIQKYLLDNTHSHLLTLVPDPNLTAEKEAALAEKLAAIKAQLSFDDIQGIIQSTKELKAKQQSVDSPEVLATIPLLNLKDIEPKAKEYKVSKDMVAGINHYYYHTNTNGIAYVSFYFDARPLLGGQDFMYLQLFNELLGKVNTEHYTYGELDNAIRINSGGIASKIGVFDGKDDDKDYCPYFVIKTKALYNQLPKVTDLIKEMLCHSLFDDKQRIKQILLELKVGMETNILRQSHTVAKSQLYSYLTPGGYLRNLSCLPFYNFVKDILKDYDNKFPAIQASFAELLPKITSKQGLKVLVTAEKQHSATINEHLTPFYGHLNNESFPNVTIDFKPNKLNEGFITSSTVQYVFKGGDYKQLGFDYSGAMRVLDTVLRYEYLWTNIRVVGGAYGSFVDFNRNGLLSFGSYRDPNLKNTVDVYDNTYKFIENLELTDREMTKYIIGTISKADMPISKDSEGQLAFARELKQMDQAFFQKERDEILNCTPADLRKLAGLIKACMDENALCVVGSANAINENKELFNNVKNIM